MKRNDLLTREMYLFFKLIIISLVQFRATFIEGECYGNVST